MDRSNFLKSLGLLSLAGTIPINSAPKMNPAKPFWGTFRPEKLKTGDNIGIIAPGSFISESELKDCFDNLTKLGFNPVAGKYVLEKNGYLAGTDEQRAYDVVDMFSRTDIQGIVCARGGYGCARILPMLDYEIIEDNPKVVIGYSDITALLYGIYSQTGLVCFHGPVGISTFNEFSVKNFNDVLVNPIRSLTLRNAIEDREDENYHLKTIVSGKSKGRLIGGNLSIVVSMLGTPYDIDLDGKILFLEEVGEQPYRVDRMLTQMIQAEKFNDIAGIAIGIFSNSNPKNAEFSDSFRLLEVLEDRLRPLNVPVLYGMSFGHITNKFTLPFGVEAELNADDMTLTLLEPAVNY